VIRGEDDELRRRGSPGGKRTLSDKGRVAAVDVRHPDEQGPPTPGEGEVHATGEMEMRTPLRLRMRVSVFSSTSAAQMPLAKSASGHCT